MWTLLDCPTVPLSWQGSGSALPQSSVMPVTILEHGASFQLQFAGEGLGQVVFVTARTGVGIPGWPGQCHGG